MLDKEVEQVLDTLKFVSERLRNVEFDAKDGDRKQRVAAIADRVDELASSFELTIARAGIVAPSSKAED